MSRLKFLLIYMLIMLTKMAYSAPPPPPSSSSTSTSSSLEEEAKKYLKDANIRIFKAFEDFQDYQFKSKIENPDEVFQHYLIAIKTVINEANYIKRNYPYEQFHDLELKREIQSLINDGGIFVLNENDLINLYDSLKSLHKLPTLKQICPYNKITNDCNYSYLPNIQDVIENVHDPLELQHYWIEWRNLTTHYAPQHFENVIRMYKEASKINGQNPHELWFKDYEDVRFLYDLEDVMKQLEPFYKEIHAYIRNVLYVKYGSRILTNTGLIPHHLAEQILAQAWNPNSLLEHPYPNKNLPEFKHKLESNKFSPRKIVERADQFFRSLGLPELPQKFWSEHIIQKEDEGFLDSCKATVYDDIPIGALKYCPQSNIRKFLQMHGYMARLHYVNNERHLPYAFYDSFNFEYGVGEAAILSASSPKHMKRIGLLPEFNYDDERTLNRLFRLAIHTMLNLPVHFVQSKLLADVLSNRIEIRNLNIHYWRLMEKYTGFEPPVNRNALNYDFGYKFYEDLTENHQTRKFVGEILGYQFYRSFCELSGEFIRYDANHTLHNCDFYGSLKAGAVLKQMMSLGSSRPWRQVLSRILGHDANLNAGALLEFFEPVKIWIEEQNRKNNLTIGWGTSSKRIYSSK